MNADLVVPPMPTAQNNNYSPMQWEQPSQDPDHVHFFFHASLLVAHHGLHTRAIAKDMNGFSLHCHNHNSMHLPASFDVVLGEPVTPVFVVETTCKDGEVEV